MFGNKTIPINNPQGLADPIFRIRVTPDKMQAYLSVGVPDNCREITTEDLLKALEDRNIKYGINEKEIERCCSLKSFFSEIFCAQGKMPIAGQDGTMSFLFEINPEPKPAVRADGSTDYHDMGIIQSVKKDQVLCTRTMPIPGEDGIDVFGEVVAFKPGAEKRFGNGKNTYISDNELELRAEIDGCINYKNNLVTIDDTFTVRGNVDNATGDINFCGNVVVTGDVREGFKVHSGNNVTISGMVEGATIWAQGDMQITQGMNGMNTGCLYCGGNIKSKYFQNTEILCQGDVTADYYLNASVISGGTITASGSKGLILGGTHQAGKEVVAKTIGADSYLSTSVTIKDSEQGFWNPEIQKTQEEIENELSEMTEEEQEQWMAEHVYKAPSAPEGARVVVKAVAHPGVKIAIGQTVKNLNEEYNNTKFFLGEEGIEIAPA